MTTQLPNNLSTVAQHMDVVIHDCQAKMAKYGFLPFIYTYRAVTREVIRCRSYNVFKDPNSLEQLDVVFANLFFKPYAQFVDDGQAPSPWHTYFEYCKRQGGDPLLQMLLGINAHINGDLAVAMVHSNYMNRHDFLVIDVLLEKVIPYVLKYLAFRHRSVLSFGALLFPWLTVREFKQVIGAWREDAWQASQLLREGALAPTMLHEKAEHISRDLIALFEHKYYVHTWPARRRKLHSLHLVRRGKV